MDGCRDNHLDGDLADTTLADFSACRTTLGDVHVDAGDSEATRLLPCHARPHDRFVYGWFGTQPLRIDRYDLGSTRVNIDLTATKTFVCVKDDELSPVFPRHVCPQPLEFALAVARAAICTAPAPPVPLDALVG